MAEVVRGFRDLRVWRGAMDLGQEIYQVSVRFPSEEGYGLRAQIRRACGSVPSNIAEGHARSSTKEYLNHISMAQASLAEVETQVEIAVRLEYIAEEKAAALFTLIQQIRKQLYALRNALESKK